MKIMVNGGNDTGSQDKQKKPRINWEDPEVPVGNAPPMPRWPVLVLGIAWIGWITFLIVMMLSRVQAGAA